MPPGSGIQYGSVHPRATPMAAAPPSTRPNTTATPAAADRARWSPSRTAGAPNRRAMTMPYSVAMATMTP